VVGRLKHFPQSLRLNLFSELAHCGFIDEAPLAAPATDFAIITV
jgi:hypothetical protein